MPCLGLYTIGVLENDWSGLAIEDREILVHTNPFECHLTVCGGELRGRLIDSSTRNPLCRAIVELGHQQMFSDDRGRFRFRGPDLEDARIEVFAPGYPLCTKIAVDADRAAAGEEIVIPVGEGTATMRLKLAGIAVRDIRWSFRVSIDGRRCLMDGFLEDGPNAWLAHGLPAGRHEIKLSMYAGGGQWKRHIQSITLEADAVTEVQFALGF